MSTGEGGAAVKPNKYLKKKFDYQMRVRLLVYSSDHQLVAVMQREMQPCTRKIQEVKESSPM